MCACQGNPRGPAARDFLKTFLIRMPGVSRMPFSVGCQLVTTPCFLMVMDNNGASAN